MTDFIPEEDARRVKWIHISRRTIGHTALPYSGFPFTAFAPLRPLPREVGCLFILQKSGVGSGRAGRGVGAGAATSKPNEYPEVSQVQEAVPQLREKGKHGSGVLR